MVRRSGQAAAAGLALWLCASLGESEELALPVEQLVAVAERHLKQGELQLAESTYREALREGWLIRGTLARLDGSLDEARAAFARASSAAADDRRALQALGLTDLQGGRPAAAAAVLSRLSRRDPRDAATRRLLAQALQASGRLDDAIRELESARAAAPADAETCFALGAAHLAAKQLDAAERAFAELSRLRPQARTRVLIARTWRDAGEYGRARAEIAKALANDPRVARAHYYLGTVAVAEKGRAGLEEAIAAFRAELRVAPGDVPTNLELGVALVDTQRYEEAIAPLELAAAAEPGDPRMLYYLGRAQLALGRAEPAAASLAQALERTREHGSGEQQRVIHNQLGQALRQLGRDDEAAAHFAEAQRLSALSAQSARDQMAGSEAVPAEPEALAAGTPLVELSPLASLGGPERDGLARRVAASLARSYVNLGVMLARAERFSRAAEQFELAAAVDPDFPQVQSSLGIALFNARRFDAAQGPLARALAANPGDADVKRMLAMARLNTQDYAGAAELLQGDPELERDASLRFAYGLALSRSNQPERAEEVFKTLLSRQGEQAELAVLLGKAHAQMGDFKAAIASFERAIALRPDVAEAQGALGVIYFKQGQLEQAEQALRAELARSPGDVQSRLNLAQVLESSQRPDEAVPLLRDVLEAQPDFADARYLLGKILLAQGATAESIAQLEAATRLAPEVANAHYQLARAYTTLGRADDAQRHFEVFRQIKARR